jgi:hypothetical protein
MTAPDAVALLLDALAEPLADRIASRLRREQADELVAFPFSLEVRTARALVRGRKLPTTKIGRKIYTLRSAVLALVNEAPELGPAPRTAIDAAAAARAAYGRPRLVREAR